MTASANTDAIRAAQRTARHLWVEGRVQGVGFRPFIYRLAHEHRLNGWVVNNGGRVEILVEGEPESLDAFVADLIDRAPPLARPIIAEGKREKAQALRRFEIRHSRSEGAPRIHVPPDQFACDDCLREMNDPEARRFRYPFINCTQCGPRYTIIRAMPYDRPNTTMQCFELCDDCVDEYGDPLDRRFHAQPLACPDCGPSLVYRDHQRPIRENAAALRSCVATLRAGGIVGIRGIGGYHLVCDATSEPAIRRLRVRKQRPDKPLAVMVPAAGKDGLDWVRRVARPNRQHALLLVDPMRPIVLVPSLPDSRLAPGIAPGLAEIGLMLPYSPLHHLLLGEFGRPVVATSGNISGEPVITEPAEAEQRLAGVADAFLHHDRPIQRPADDPVFREISGRMRPLRIGRGSAPLELELPLAVDVPMLATGAFLKNTVALAWENRVIISPHIGDLASPRGQAVFRQVAGDLQALYGVQAKRIACDGHPDFPNSRWARDSGLEVIPVPHHFAHASAAAAESDLHEERICFTWDGVGLGEDGTLWGGEALVGTPGQWQRFASLRPFRLPGGDKAVDEPWRTALSLCWTAGQSWPAGAELCEPLLRKAFARGVNSPPTSAAGRLFDAAAALLDVTHTASFEGQGPMQLETLAAGTLESEGLSLPMSVDDNGVWRSDWAPLLSILLDSRRSVEERARRFHASLALTIREQAIQARRRHGIATVSLTGGVFQNRVLTHLARILLTDAGFTVSLPARIPLNDAGISYGQIIEAAARLKDEKST
ncbi:MAG: carbamoyltransferase HypF [Gammaproteobacteria bacterium]|jgi:hydrogenase maturation protein HypF